jgi:thioredoxin-related protein
MAETTPAASSPLKPTRKDSRGKLVFLTVGIIAVVLVYMVQRNETKLPGWETNLPAALAKAKVENRKVLVFVSSSPRNETDERVVKELLLFPDVKKVFQRENYVLVEIHLSENPDFAKKNSVQTTPTCVLLDSDGNMLARQMGFTNPPGFCNDFLKAPINP